jgi:glycosyltransferase involved in cell wall biosynthesis
LVICTHNRVDLLPRCIEAARRQTLDAGRFEIVVVDNASTDSTAALLRRFEDVRSVYCAEQGLSNARNLGVLAARAPIVAYIDDDAIADPDLLEKLLEAYRTHPDAGCVGGRIDVMLPPTLPGWYTPEFEGYYSAYTPRENKIHRLRDIADFPYGANLSFRKEALERIGMFRTKLGRVGRNQSGGEEIDAESRIAKLGYGVYCQPAARVEHVILPARLDWPHIENSARAAGRNWAHYEHEGLYPKQPLSADLRAWREARERMRRAGRQTFPHSQEIFLRAKWLRKLRSRLPPV